jgi:hypothetical protein
MQQDLHIRSGNRVFGWKGITHSWMDASNRVPGAKLYNERRKLAGDGRFCETLPPPEHRMK